ncbi:MAG: flagellar filament outer layer protein FlaA [Spirochaetes bacterium]|nr:flagellar filament outer layer protein FlaA [Spirochaetota bacterium]
MIEKIGACILVIFAVGYGYSQDNKTKPKETPARSNLETAEKSKSEGDSLGAHIYYEVTIENFDDTNYTDKDTVYFKKSDAEWAGIAIRDEFPAPLSDSKKYLGVKMMGKSGNALQIIPPKRLFIDKYCQSISMWIYGKNLAGEVSILLKDFVGTSHHLVFDRINYSGWRKLTVNIPRKIAQEELYLNQKSQMEILKIIYKPLTESQLPREHRFYIDDITAMVREKYVDRQSDEW